MTSLRHLHTRTGLLLLSSLLLALPAVAGPVTQRVDRFEFIGAVARWADVRGLIDKSNAPNLVGRERWTELADRHEAAIKKTNTHEAFAAAVNRLLTEAGVSHFYYVIDTQLAYWNLRSAFGGSKPETHVTHVGIEPLRIDGAWFVGGILEGSPAAGGKICVGDELLTVDGEPFSEVEALAGKEGRPVELRLRRRPGLAYAVTLTPVKESLHLATQRAMVESVRVIEHEGMTFAYLHGWSTLGRGEEYRATAKLQPKVDGLIVDYRDGHGGTWFNASRFLLSVGGPSPTNPAPSHWYKPYVVLTALGTRSAKEVIVHEIKKKNRALLVGTPTPGHVTAVGGIPRVGEDGMLMLPGHKLALEGHPIQPDILVERDIRYSGGDDPQMDKAKEVLAEIVRQWDGPAESAPEAQPEPAAAGTEAGAAPVSTPR